MRETAQSAYEAFQASANPDIIPDWANMPEAHREHWRRAAAEAVTHDRLYVPKFGEVVPQWACRIEAQNKSILEAIMATQADLDAGIATLTADDVAVLAAVKTAGTAVDTALDDLIAKIQANPGQPASDFTPEVTALAQTHADFTSAIASLSAIATTSTTDDPGPLATDGTTPAGTGSTNTTDPTDAETGTNSTTGS